MPPPGLDKLRHLVVLMMENRSFDHMLGALKSSDGRIDGVDPKQKNLIQRALRSCRSRWRSSRVSWTPIPITHFPASTCSCSTAT